MMLNTITPADLRVRDAALQELAWDSRVDASDVGVTAHDGVVTLTGFIDTYTGKLAAERAVKRVRGVRAVANDIQVRLRIERTDADLAHDAARALDLRANMPDAVQAVVHNGHLTLTGTVPALFDRVVAEKAVRHLPGLKGLVNRIVVVAPASPAHVRKAIIQALHRDAAVHADGIEVTVNDGTVVLTGAVATWAERESAEAAACHAPGIVAVDNRLEVIDLAAGEHPDELC